MEDGYGEVRGKCKDCYGCNRLELMEFNGVYRCDNYKQYIKIEKENMKMRSFEFVSRLQNEGIAINDNGILKNEKGMLKLPERSTAVSAGYDFFNPERVRIEPNEIKYVKTGIKAAFPEGEMLMLCNRSSNPKKKGLVLANGVGIVDSDYYNNPDNEGEIAFAFMNISRYIVEIDAGEKLGQGIFVKFGIVDDDNAEGTRTGGFGSTGK